MKDFAAGLVAGVCAGFVIGSIYGRRAEQKAIVKIFQAHSAITTEVDKATAFYRFIRARIAHLL
jgi:hypothetical protein